MRTVRHLAGTIGPRLATGPAFREAADYVTDRFTAQGYTVTRSTFPVPAGDSWGVAVRAGRSSNVAATPPGFDPDSPYVLVGAHLDTVSVAPGAEDNASGIAVLLELARVVDTPQVVFVAFGGEEPRGTGDLHHFGSKDYVAALTEDEGHNLHGMVALDRVGVGRTVPLSSADGTPAALRDQLAGVADDLHVRHRHRDRLSERPRVLRRRGLRRGTRRQHAVRRLPLGRRRAGRRTPRSARPGGADPHELAPRSLNAQNGSRMLDARDHGTSRGARSMPIR